MEGENLGAWEVISELTRTWGLYYFARTAVTDYHRLEDFNNRYLFSLSFGDWKSEITVLAGLVSYETFLLGL